MLDEVYEKYVRIGGRMPKEELGEMIKEYIGKIRLSFSDPQVVVPIIPRVGRFHTSLGGAYVSFLRKLQRGSVDTEYFTRLINIISRKYVYEKDTTKRRIICLYCIAIVSRDNRYGIDFQRVYDGLLPTPKQWLDYVPEERRLRASSAFRCTEEQFEAVSPWVRGKADTFCRLCSILQPDWRSFDAIINS